jgi:hypothetical protein
MNIPKYIIVHHTGGTDANPLADTSSHTMEQVDQWHRAKGWDGIGYNWYIEKSGAVKQGRDEKKEGAHTVGYNNQSIGICLAGNFDATLPTKEQEKSLAGLIASLRAKYTISAENVVPHRKFANKTCYGKKLAEDWARKLIFINEPQKPIKERLLAVKKEVEDIISLIN